MKNKSKNSILNPLLMFKRELLPSKPEPKSVITSRGSPHCKSLIINLTYYCCLIKC